MLKQIYQIKFDLYYFVLLSTLGLRDASLRRWPIIAV